MNLLANIQDDERQLKEMSDHWNAVDGTCCPACMFGEHHTKVYSRLRRRIERFDQISSKIWRDEGLEGPPPKPYFSLEF